MRISLKTSGLLLLWSSIIGFCFWQWTPKFNRYKAPVKIVGIQWNDSLFKHLPKGMDTSIIVKDSKGNPLTFRQYIVPVFNHEAMIFQDRGTWRLHRLTKEANDSMANNDDVAARRDRAAAYRTPDTEQEWIVKLDNIAHTLSMADHILVLKSKRKMIISRKNQPVVSFDIDLGFNPVGNKETDGDGRTPEGIYDVEEKRVRRDKFHKSFWISYPNETDKAIAKKKGLKPGYSILIHGTTNARVNSKDWTAGCIALQNDDIDRLFEIVNSGTVIEIQK
ncbi:murein L,D-transpeptidase family protein [Pedobacter frigoris]|uniref:L,D-transpeptidase family protein n=1 Tax=Pedobacter frigoris TaxID=2571272 RepID=UPI00292FE62F|nr:L,D-transpeptidase family protein [Pedobacter frigoris]